MKDFPVFLELDFTRFDQTLNKDILTIVEECLLTDPFRSQYPELAECLRLSLRTRGVSGFGTSYVVEGTRCSGDAHTSIGNGLIAHFLVWTCLRKLPKASWTSFHEGDDGVLGIHEAYVEQAEYNLQFLRCMGLAIKVRRCVNLEDVLFCGRRLVDGPDGPTTICDVTRTLRKFNTSVSLGPPDLLMYAKALSYNYTDKDTPLIGSLSYSLAEVLGYCRHKYSRRKLRNAVMRIHQERWVLRDGIPPKHWTKLLNALPPNPSPHSLSAVIRNDNVNYALIQQLEAQYTGWKQLGFIPDTFTKLELDWHPTDARTEVYGPMSNWVS